MYRYGRRFMAVAVAAADADIAQRIGTVVGLAAARVDTESVPSFPRAAQLLDLVDHMHSAHGDADPADNIVLHPPTSPTHFD